MELGGFILVAIAVVFVIGGFSRATTTSNFARQGYGGRFRRVSKAEVDSHLAAISELVDQVALLKTSSGRPMSPEQARFVIERAKVLATRLDAACDSYEDQNFSFAHKRTARKYGQVIAEARRIARELRDGSVLSTETAVA
jgi:hypothetical protein